MSATVRPTSAILRRARHVPVTQCLGRRWQTSTAQPQSYEEMLSGLEAEFPDPSAAPSRSKRMNEHPKSPRKRGQPIEDTHTPRDTATLPAVESFGNAPRTDTGEESRVQRAPKFKNTLENNNESVKPPFQKQSTTNNKDTPKPRGIPPPSFKPSSEPPTKQHVPEKPMIRNMWHSDKRPEQPQALEEDEFPQTQSDLPQTQSDLPQEQFEFLQEPSDAELPPRPATEPDSNLTSTNKVLNSVETSKPRPKPAKVSQKHVTSIDTPTGELHGSDPMNIPLNPLETVKIRVPYKWKEGDRPLHYDNIFLRDSCACTQCVNTSTRQKRFDTADIPANISIRSLKYDGDSVVITWKHDVSGFGPDHRTWLSRDFLHRAPRTPVDTAYSSGKWAWSAAQFEAQMVDYDYNDYKSDDKVLFQLLRQLHTFGLVFIKNVPESESAVIDTANRIGPLKNTFYGDTWDVRSVSNAKNVAYTDVHLGFHMDLLYMQQPPRLQLLHCLRASEQGGVSLFSDSYRAVDQLHDLDPDAFSALAELPVNFHYDNDNHHYFRSRRTFQLREDALEPQKHDKRVWGGLEAVNWAPPFQAPFSHTHGNVALAQSTRRWHEAAQLFRNLTEMKSAVYRRQMAPGECVIFDNRRVLHARTAFAGGERWLRGAYLDDDPYLSKIRVLERTYGDVQKMNWLKSMPRT